LLAKLTKSHATVHIVTASPQLSKRDEEVFQKWRGISTTEMSTAFHSSLDFDFDKKDLVLVDEADLFIFNETVSMQSLLKRA